MKNYKSRITIHGYVLEWLNATAQHVKIKMIITSCVVHTEHNATWRFPNPFAVIVNIDKTGVTEEQIKLLMEQGSILKLRYTIRLNGDGRAELLEVNDAYPCQRIGDFVKKLTLRPQH